MSGQDPNEKRKAISRSDRAAEIRLAKARKDRERREAIRRENREKYARRRAAEAAARSASTIGDLTSQAAARQSGMVSHSRSPAPVRPVRVAAPRPGTPLAPAPMRHC